ncbi:MAG: hypothetical protein JEZ05_07960 [Tenericutes bacterium]|nr:hypothetical protein [Mycoplasmatota bacterium]
MNITKKISIVILLIMAASLLYGCNNVTSNTENTELNDTLSTKEDIKDKIEFYVQKLLILGNLEGEIMESNNNLETKDSPMKLSTGYEDYDREDLPEQYMIESAGINPEFIIITTDTLDQFTQILDSCESFVEGEFVNVTYFERDYVIKMSTNEDLLYIESYHYEVVDEVTTIHAEIMNFDLIEEKIFFEYVRDYQGRNNHIIYYDEFDEAGNIINIALNVDDNELSSYQIYDRALDKTFYIYNASGEYHMNYSNHSNDGNASFSIELDNKGAITRYNLQYRYINYSQSFWYTLEDGNIHLMWNLYLTEGWNKCRVYNNYDNKIYLDETELLEDFTISISIQDRYANARLTILESEFSESLMDLSDYGLLFNDVTYLELQSDIDYIDEFYISIIEDYGLSLNMENCYNTLFETIPYNVDSTVVQSISSK